VFEQQKRRQMIKELATLSLAGSPYLVGFFGAYFDGGR
jgi:hypothetical protein